MDMIKKLWNISYDILKFDSVSKKNTYLQSIIDDLLLQGKERECCLAIEKLQLYYFDFSEEYKQKYREILNGLITCHACEVCCKNARYIERRNKELQGINRLQNDSCALSELTGNELFPEKIALIIPDYLSASSFLQPPIDFMNISRELKEMNFHPVFIDNRVKRYGFEELYSHIKNCKYVVVTTSPYDHIQNYFLDFRLRLTFQLIDYLKRKNPDSVIIVCGAHGTVMPNIVFKECMADYVIRGEYDYTVSGILQSMINKNRYNAEHLISREDDLSENLSDKTDFSVERNTQDYQTFIDKIPDYDDVILDNYYGDIYINNKCLKHRKFSAILASRGCYNTCSFCYNFFGRCVKYRNPQSVVDEMELLEKMGAEGLFFIDSTFTQNEEWVYNICADIIKRKLTIKWSAETRCDKVNKDLLRIMHMANCTALWLGVESFSESVLKKNSKHINLDQILSAISWCKEVGIQPQQFIMIGAPGETVNSLNHTFSYLRQLRETYVESVMITTPRFGSDLYRLAKRQYPHLGNDFYSLKGVAGLVDNTLTSKILYESMIKFRK